MERTYGFLTVRSVPNLTKQIPSYLKLVTDTSSETHAASEDLASISDACQAFVQATGWQLEVAPGPPPTKKTSLMWSAPVNPGVGDSPGHIRLLSSGQRSSGQPPVALEHATQLAGAVGKMWSELVATRHALAQREAELASGVPIVVRPSDDESPPMATRLEAVLRAGAQAIGCEAAALYLLDAATTELKLRASWGLPRRRMTEPARELRGALADLEALLGHAVVSNDERLYSYWKVPEPGYAACVCVPLLSQSMPLGTLWAFASRPRDFSDAQTNILEVVAGRVVAELERGALVAEALAARNQVKQLVLVDDSPSAELPVAAPYVEGWEIAARAVQGGLLGGTFYDWFAVDDGGLAIVVGDAIERGLGGALTAVAARAACRACGLEITEPAKLLERVNATLWTTSSGKRQAGLFAAILEPRAGACSLAAAGPIRVLALGADGYDSLPALATNPGSDEQLGANQARQPVPCGECLLVYGTSWLDEPSETELCKLDERLAAALISRGKATAGELVDVALEVISTHQDIGGADRLALGIRRRP
jgi:hypothetical protein